MGRIHIFMNTVPFCVYRSSLPPDGSLL